MAGLSGLLSFLLTNHQGLRRPTTLAIGIIGPFGPEEIRSVLGAASGAPHLMSLI